MFLPGMLFMSVLFIANGMAGDLWDERRAGTLRRFVSSPQTTWLMLGGKMLTAEVLQPVAKPTGARLSRPKLAAPCRQADEFRADAFAGGCETGAFGGMN